MTDRVLRAIANPYVDVIAHPTGRLILKREGYRLDLERVLAAAAEAGVALEINSQLDRLDLDDTHARMARERGVKLIVDSDAHSPGRSREPALGRDDGAARVAGAGRRAQHAAAGRVPGVAPEESLMARKIPLTPVTAAPRSTAEILAEIRQLYFKTTKTTILNDFDRAIDLLKSIPEMNDRQQATVYVEGLAEMRKEFTASNTSSRRGGRTRGRSGRS